MLVLWFCESLNLLRQEKHEQTKYAKIRLLLEEQSDQGLFVSFLPDSNYHDW